MNAWTTERPTQAGYYWARISDYAPSVVHVQDYRFAAQPQLRIKGYPLEHYGRGDEQVCRCKYEWYGPIEPPT